MNRRKALKNLGLSLGTITLSPAVLSLLQSCKNDLGWNPIFFNSNQVNIVSEITDIIIPSDEDNVSNKNEQVLLKKSLDSFLEDCLVKSGKINLKNIERNDLESSLVYFFKTKIDSHNKWREVYNKFKRDSDSENNNLIIEALSFNFINTIRQLTITAFKGSEYIGKNVLIYRPIPGEQKGCVDLEEATGGRAWTI
jgi:hypothetical protein